MASISEPVLGVRRIDSEIRLIWGRYVEGLSGVVGVFCGLLGWCHRSSLGVLFFVKGGVVD